MRQKKEEIGGANAPHEGGIRGAAPENGRGSTRIRWRRSSRSRNQNSKRTRGLLRPRLEAQGEKEFENLKTVWEKNIPEVKPKIEAR
jgi:hypothetical protein